ncbi:MAG: hypothetical protein NC218_08545 [Acetobacter sp.]|nr:hypothetical protein [Acetobacter sp.]
MKREMDDLQITRVIETCFENFTIKKTVGVYTMQEGNNEGKTIVEDTFVVTVLVASNNSWNDNKIANVCKFLKNMLNQETVAVERLVSQVDFI